MSPTGPRRGEEPLVCEQFGHGLGRPDGVLVVRYRSTGRLAVADGRDDFLHQLFWAPAGYLSLTTAERPVFVGPRRGVWVRRGTRHVVDARDQDEVYRVCLREVPGALDEVRAGPAEVTDEAVAALLRLAVDRLDDLDGALRDRTALLAGLHPADEVARARGRGYALAVADRLAHAPDDPTDLAGWAERLHISPKTLQRDVVRTFGTSWTRWRTEVRLAAADALLATCSVGVTARRVGYATASAFVAAYARERGHTPGRVQRTAVERRAPSVG
ncbi:helix-turn-helix transcriptional regulator [Actinomycetospora sp. OC33-EN08]|uniref:Helix-turn-helix transcriptional regulator n=1 Tax=Actinomycetospora aurantiaca TaxID=3129233 RepID=A0ABU8MUM6_9PSEU